MFEIELPLRTVPESNRGGEHWATKSKRHNQQKLLMKAAMRTCDIKPPCKITLTRIAPRPLDSHDNLASSFKWVVDSIASLLTGDRVSGRADSHPGLFFAYNQEKRGVREYVIKIRIESIELISNPPYGLIYKPPSIEEIQNNPVLSKKYELAKKICCKSYKIPVLIKKITRGEPHNYELD